MPIRLMPRRGASAFVVSLLAGCLLAACGTDDAAAPKLDRALIGTPDGPLVATVNGEAVTEPLLVVYAKGHGHDPGNPEQRQKALDGLIENILLAQHGIETGLTAKDDVQAELALVRMQQLSGRTLSTLRRSLEVSEEQVAAYYAEETARAGDTEWRLQHILLADRAAADAVLALATAEGADFEQLISTQAPIARQARTLDWGHAGQLPAELAEAARQLEPGQVAPVPIETRFGWHVIRLLEQRPFAPPSLDQVREGARRELQQRALAEQVAALRSKATIVTATSASSGASADTGNAADEATPASPGQ